MSKRDELWKKYGGGNQEAAVQRARQREIVGQKKRESDAYEEAAAERKGKITPERYERDSSVGLTKYQLNKNKSAEQEAQKGSRLGQMLKDTWEWGTKDGWIGKIREYREDTSYREPNEEWKQEWLDEFGYRYRHDPESAHEFAQQVNDYLKAGKLAESEEQLKDWSMKHPILATGASIVSSPLGLLDLGDNLAEYLGRGTITQRGSVTPETLSRTVVSGISEGLNEKYGTLDEGIPVIGGRGWGDAYALANSALQSLGLGNTLGSAGTLATFFGQSASSGIEEVKARGGSDEQALLYGLLSGAAEAAAEKLPLDNLLKGGDAMHYTFKSWMGNALKQAGLEGSEELITSVANGFADQLIMGEKSNFNVRVQKLMAEGMSREEARKRAWIEFAEDAAFDFIGGAVSGMGSMTAQTAAPTLIQNHQTRNSYDAEMEELLLEAARDTEEGSRPYAMAQKIAGKGKSMTGGQINDLIAANDQYFQQEEQSSLAEQVEERLDKLDVQDGALATAITKTLMEQELTRKERKALQNSAEGRKVLADLQQELGTKEETHTVKTPAGPFGQISPNATGKAEQHHREQTLRQGAEQTATADESQSAPDELYHPDPEWNYLDPAPEPVRFDDVETDTETDEAAQQRDIAKYIEEVAESFGDQAAAVRELFQDWNQERQSVDGLTEGVRAAWDAGNSGLGLLQAMEYAVERGPTDKQFDKAYSLGREAAKLTAQNQSVANAKLATGGTVRRKGVVKGQNVRIQDLAETFNDPQKTAYRLLSFYAEVTGIDIVLYRGSPEQETGRFAHGENTIYIDIDAGTNDWDTTDLSAYTMMRTFAHEFVHFVEKWNPTAYNDLRKAVFAEMALNAEFRFSGQNAVDLVQIAMRERGLNFDQASREVVAEALADILPESRFAQTLAHKHKTLFEKLKERLDEFTANLKDHWKKLAGNNSREARALKRQVGEALSYAEEIVQLFDRAAGEAVEAYQASVAGFDETTAETTKAASETTEAASEETSARKYANSKGYRLELNKLSAMRGMTQVDIYDKQNLPTFDPIIIEAASDWNKVVQAIEEREAFEQRKAEQATSEAKPQTEKHSAQRQEASTQEAKRISNERFAVESKGGTVYVTFPGKPGADVRDGLKTRGFKWAAKKKAWYAKDDPEQVEKLLRELMSGVPETSPDVIRAKIENPDSARVDRMPEPAPVAEKAFDKAHDLEENVEPAAEAAKPEAREMEGNTPSEKLANAILSEHLSKGVAMDARALYALADRAFDGTQGEGAYNRKDAYDAMELAVNKHLLSKARDMNGDISAAQKAVTELEELLKLLPTQSVRTQEQQDFQQFSTPPNIAYLAAWAGNVQAGEQVLEPSAGIGGIAVFAKSWGAEVAVNELSERRLGVLKSMGFDHVFNENAEQLDNVLPENIKPSLVLMNPPFSSTAGRTARNKTSNAERHIDQALARLADGGRLVAILGKGMNDADYYKYWDKVRKEYSVRANLSIDGSNYKKYGTTWGVQLVVIDKTGPQTGQTLTGSYTDLTQVPKALEEIRNDRRKVEGNDPGRGDDHGSLAAPDGRVGGVPEAGSAGGRERSGGKPARDSRQQNRDGIPGSNRAGSGSGHDGVRKPVEGTGSSPDGQRVRGSDGADHRADDAPAVAGEPSGSESQRASGLSEEQREDDGVYATFVLPEVPVPGGRKHPATLVESAAMAAVPMPRATYKPQLPANVVKNNLSDAQMVTVTYAGQAHEQMLPDGSRKGFFVGDGTGVGKGRQIAGIILDNFMQGRTKAVWVSKNGDLYGDAIRDWTGTTGRSKDEVLNHSKTKLGASIAADSGILFTTYPMLRSGKNDVNRLDQIVAWLGEDFDGVIAFDEAHNMGNLYGRKSKMGKSKGSDMAKAGVELQRRLPKARIVYVSATAATEVDNLAYAERLGLWGKGTAFSNAQDFISKIGSSGLAAMELVIRDMKAMGVYTARSISYQGVAYDTIEHTLDENQTIIYNTMSSAWQTVMQNANKALELTGGKNNSRARQLAMGQFYSSMQRFYNQALTSMSMPSVIADMRRELESGRSCVLQIVNTNEAQQNKALAQAKAENLELDDLDLTPRESLIGYLETCFPVQEFEEYTDEDGSTKSRPVVNSKGEPVLSKKAVAMREALIEEINSMSIPDGPMEMLFDAFGTENVAENTGRSRRVVPKRQSDGTVRRVEERRTLNSRTADVQAFQDGKKRVLVFSDAGGTGKSYHADRSEKNQQQRIHYVLQPGWSASNAVQGFGRTHRSNEASAPIYKLVTTNIKGQKRFTSTIARRLDQLGALTKGQRDTGSGMFGAKDNLETDLARDSLREFYKRLGRNKIEGIDGMKTLERLGLKQKFTDEYGSFKMDETTARDIGTFLNRILALEVEEQNTVFDAFISIYEMELEAAIQAGTLDTGMENVKADKIEVLDDKIIREDGNGGAATHYIQARIYKRPKVTTTVAEAETQRSGFVGIYETDNGAVRAVYRIADKTTEWGTVVKQYRLVGPNQGANAATWQEDTLNKRAKLLDKAQWQSAWDRETKQVPEYNEETMHMLTGALLPIWNSLPSEGNTKVKRLIAADGKAYLGRIVQPSQIDLVLRQFQAQRSMEKFSPRQVMDKALSGTVFKLAKERAEIFRSRVSGEWRIEIRQTNPWQLKRYSGAIIQERINFQDRFFIPNSAVGEKLLGKMLQDNPIRETSQQDQLQVRRVALTDRQVLEMAAGRIDESKLSKAELDNFHIFQERLTRLRTLQEDRKALGQLYKEQQFGPGGDRKAAPETLDRMHNLDAAIIKAADDVLVAEQGAALRKVLQEARKVVQKDQAAHDEAVLKEYRTRRNESTAQQKYRKAVQREVRELTAWLVSPDNKDALKRVPDVLKGPVGSFIAAIDLSSSRSLKGGDPTKADSRLAEKMEAVLAAYRKHIEDVGGLYSGYMDLPPDFVERLEAMVAKTWKLAAAGGDKYQINGGEMSAADLRELYHLVREMKKHITTVNRFHANAMFQFASDAAQDTMKHLSGFGKFKNGPTDGADQFLFWKNVRPAYIFERFGRGGMAIYDGLRRGQGQLAKNTKVITAFAQKAYKGAEVRAWEKEIKRVKLPSGGNIRLTVAQMMSLYCLSKREQALPHLLGGGIRGANIKGADTEARHLTPEDIRAICDRLTKRQQAVADKLQKFMSEQGGKWGNEVTVKRFGEQQFTEDFYFPISTDGQLRNAEADKPDGSDLYALLNMSFTKKLIPKANNRVMLYSVFDVFTSHMASMAQYNAMALPVLDALKWFNYRETWKTTDGKPAQDSVREQMVRAFGSPVNKEGVKDGRGYAENFILGILKGYNGTEAQGTPNDSMGLKMLHRYNRAQVAWNVSVVVKQPLAILRAAQEISYASIARGLAVTPGQRKRDIQEMLDHSGIAAWKDLGFYDVNISRGLNKLIKHNDTPLDKYVEKGVWGAEQADRQAWGAIWNACKREVARKGIRPGSAKFFEEVTRRFEDVIYKTQVVDSILTKTEYMRDKGFYSRLTSSFMGEPVAAVSPFLDLTYRMHMEANRRGGSFQTAWKKYGTTFGRMTAVYAITAVMTGIVQSVIDAWRDDDDYMTFTEKMMAVLGSNIGGEINPFDKIPVVKELGALVSGLGDMIRGEDAWLQVSSLPMGDVAQYTYDASKILWDKIQGKNTGYTWYGSIRKYLQAASGGLGIPLATPTREVVDIWNNAVGSMAPSLKIKTYDRSADAELRDAFLAGYIGEEEATDKLLEIGKAEDENEAYWLLRKWEGGEGWSKYDALARAMAAGGDIGSAMDELTTHGIKEKTVRAQIRSIVNEWLGAGAITEDEARELLAAYGDRDSDEADEVVQRWKCEIDTGIPYSGIKEAYLDGEISEEEARQMYAKYGGYTQGEARETVTEWRAEKETGVAYGNITEAVLDGELSEAEAARMYETYGGYEPEDARAAAHWLAFIRDNPGCPDISQAAVEDYETWCESAGIKAQDFYKVWKQFNATQSIKDQSGKTVTTKREQVLAQIDAMNLTRAQKDALYFAFGYAESKLWDTPWH